MGCNMYKFRAELFVDISKVINCWENGRFKVVEVKLSKETGDYVVLAEVPNTDLVQFKNFLKKVEGDLDTYTITETIVKV